MPADPRLLSDEDLTRAISCCLPNCNYGASIEGHIAAQVGAIAAQADIIRTLTEERDLAIAHDRQPYPTADAYERVCAALHKCEAGRDRITEIINDAETFVGYPGPVISRDVLLATIESDRV
jgi:hypothetical protein